MIQQITLASGHGAPLPTAFRDVLRGVQIITQDITGKMALPGLQLPHSIADFAAQTIQHVNTRLPEIALPLVPPPQRPDRADFGDLVASIEAAISQLIGRLAPGRLHVSGVLIAVALHHADMSSPGGVAIALRRRRVIAPMPGLHNSRAAERAAADLAILTTMIWLLAPRADSATIDEADILTLSLHMVQAQIEACDKLWADPEALSQQLARAAEVI